MSDLTMDTPGTLAFWGTETAELWTRELAESYQGVLAHNYVARAQDGLPAGFVHASLLGMPWHGTMWTRDAGTYLRELVLWGDLAPARVVAGCLMDLVARNEDGYHAFPERFDGGQPSAGHEIDGTAAIMIGLVLLWQRLASGDELRARIYAFLHGPSSPARFPQASLAERPLIAGSGEFGPGCGLPGTACNVVQNNLAALALLAVAGMEAEAGDARAAESCRQTAERIWQAMARYLVDREGGWIWCVDPQTLQPDPAVIDHPINRGFGGLNGVASMVADVLGLDLLGSGWFGLGPCQRTFERLLAVPKRRELFDRYGIWTQFDVHMEGRLSSPSYGQGYALQTMLLLGRLDMAEHGLEFLARHTYDQGQYRSPYLFYERMFAPPFANPAREGCGELNLVCVAEPLKVARLILGLDDRVPGRPTLIPRLPPSWQGVEARNWPVRTPDGMTRADIRVERVGSRWHVAIDGPAGLRWAVDLDAAGRC